VTTASIGCPLCGAYDHTEAECPVAGRARWQNVPHEAWCPHKGCPAKLCDSCRCLRSLVLDARSWARHGYEIGQRSCTWSDHGVAPKWLTDEHDPDALAGRNP
jgi:hypothetical protein